MILLFLENFKISLSSVFANKTRSLITALGIIIGVLSVNVFVFIVAYIVFSAIKATIGLRLSKEGETKGTDVTETGVIAYAIRD